MAVGAPTHLDAWATQLGRAGFAVSASIWAKAQAKAKWNSGIPFDEALNLCTHMKGNSALG